MSGRVFDRQIGLIRGGIRPTTPVCGGNCGANALHATIVGNWEGSSGEFRLKESKVPDWFLKEVEAIRNACFFSDEQAVSSLLSATRKEMYDSLSTFYSQVRYTLSIGVLLLGAALLIVEFSLRPESGTELVGLRLVGACMLLAMLPLGVLACLIIQESYRMYVSAVVYAAQVHLAAKAETHHWFDWVFRYLESKPESKFELVETWMKRLPNVFRFYTWAIMGMVVLAVAGSIYLFVTAFRLIETVS